MKRILCLFWIFLILKGNHGLNSTPKDNVTPSDFEIDVTSVTSKSVYEGWNHDTTTPEEFNSSVINNVSYTETTFEPAETTLDHNTEMLIEYYNGIAIRIWRTWSPVLLGKNVAILNWRIFSLVVLFTSRTHTKLVLNWDLPKGFHWVGWIEWQNICHYSKRVQTCYSLHYKPGCYHSESKTYVRDRIFKLTRIYGSVIYQIPCICVLHWTLFPFRENLVLLKNIKKRKQKRKQFHPLCFHFKKLQCIFKIVKI